MHIDDLLRDLKDKDIFVYGAGNFAREIVGFLRTVPIYISGIFVSNIEGNPDDIDGIRVNEYGRWIDDNKKEMLKNAVLIVGINQGEKIFGNQFSEDGWENVIFSTNELIGEMLRAKLIMLLKGVTNDVIVEAEYPDLEPNFVMFFDRGKKPLSRFLLLGIEEGMAERIKEFDYNEFISEYGNMKYYHLQGERGFDQSNASLYVVTSHNNKTSVSTKLPKGYEMVQAGAKNAPESMPYLRDDMGDNISGKNIYYSECTVHYWIWKNIIDRDYVGVGHYRRQQPLNDNAITWMKENNVDILTAMPQFVLGSVGEFYVQYIDAQLWGVMEDAMSQEGDVYADSLKTVKEGHFYFPCNILFGKKKAFDEYCEYLFRVTKRVENIIEGRGIQVEKRYMGYLTEIFESAYLVMNKGKHNTAYTDVRYYNA